MRRRRGQPDFEPKGTDHFGRSRVLRRLGRQFAHRIAIEIGLAVEQRLSLCVAGADGVHHILPARLVGVEESAFQHGAKPFGQDADRGRCDKAGVVAQQANDASKHIGRHEHVGVDECDPGEGRVPPALHHVVQLGIHADRVVPDQQPRRNLRMSGQRGLDKRDHRVCFARDAE